MKRKKLYLSGGMTGIPNLNKEAFEKAAKALRAKGYVVINPHDLDKKQPCRTWEACLQRDIKELMDCQEIAVLPKWQKSRGANLEVYIGRALKYPVHPVRFYL